LGLYQTQTTNKGKVMTITGRIEILWTAKFWDALGCGASEDGASRAADAATSSLRALLRSVERTQQPRLPRWGASLAGRKQHAIAKAEGQQ
jgi:hypothetical protein